MPQRAPISIRYQTSQNARQINWTPGAIFIVWIWLWRLARRFVQSVLQDQSGDFGPLTRVARDRSRSPGALSEAPSQSGARSDGQDFNPRVGRPLSNAAQFLRERKALRPAPILSATDAPQAQAGDLTAQVPDLGSAAQCVLCDALWSPPPSFSSWRISQLSRPGRWDIF